MISARTQCPHCEGPSVVDLADILYSPDSDYFRCRDCGAWWILPKGEDQPARQVVLGKPVTPNLTQKAG